LEFFIPQICSLLLQGYYPKQDELETFILSASREFHFSHRILFFLQSIIVDKLDDDQKEIQNNCINRVVTKLLKQVDRLDESLFLANSHDFERLLPAYGLKEFFVSLRPEGPIRGYTELTEKRLKKV